MIHHPGGDFKVSPLILRSAYTECFLLKSPEITYKACITFCKGRNFEDLSTFLHDEEAEYLKTLQYQRRVNSYLLGRYSAKKSISALTNESNLRRILIKNGIFNQPIVSCDSILNTQISLAHSDDLACAVAFDERIILGIDIEKKNQEIARVIEGELTQYEWNHIRSIAILDDFFFTYPLDC